MSLQTKCDAAMDLLFDIFNLVDQELDPEYQARYYELTMLDK